MGDELRMLQGGTSDAEAMADVLVEVWADAYADRVATGNPFSSPAAFAERLANCVVRPGFQLCTGWIDGELVGYTFGTRPDARAWLGADVAREHAEIAGDGGLFVVNELMVRRAWHGGGVGRRLHDRLVHGLEGVTHIGLYVRPDNHPARHLYASLGYVRVGSCRPKPDYPEFDVMVRGLG